MKWSRYVIAAATLLIILVSNPDLSRVDFIYGSCSAKVAYAAVGATPIKNGGVFKKISTQNIVFATEFGATPGSLEDQTPYFQDAINHLISIGGGTLFIPNGTYKLIAKNPTIENPKRIAIRGTVAGPQNAKVIKYVENINIVGDVNTIMLMEGIDEAYLIGQDDLASSGRDIFTVFSFCYCKNCSVSNITIKGNYMKRSLKFRYASPRAKGIGFFGCIDCSVDNVKGYNLLGNLVNSTPAANKSDGYWASNIGVTIKNCLADTTYENGLNNMAATHGAVIENCTLINCNSCGIESSGQISNNMILNSSTGIGLYDGAVASENLIDGCNLGFLCSGSVKNNDYQYSIFSGNLVKNSKGSFFQIYPSCGNVIIENNRFIEANLDKNINYNKAVYLVGLSNKPIKNVNIVNNYFEIKNSVGFCNTIIAGTHLQDSYIVNNIFNIKLPSVIADIHSLNFVNCVIADNLLVKGIIGNYNNGSNLVNNNK